VNDDVGGITFNHYIQVAHRLYLQPGKCQQIHGHSMNVELTLSVTFDTDGYATNQVGDQLEFGEVKRAFRRFLDEGYDHKLLLNASDPFAGPIWSMGKVVDKSVYPEKPLLIVQDALQEFLPGLRPCMGDPCTENLAKWIVEWCAEEFSCYCTVTIHETNTNSVSREASPGGKVWINERGEIDGATTE